MIPRASMTWITICVRSQGSKTSSPQLRTSSRNRSSKSEELKISKLNSICSPNRIHLWQLRWRNDRNNFTNLNLIISILKLNYKRRRIKDRIGVLKGEHFRSKLMDGKLKPKKLRIRELKKLLR